MDNVLILDNHTLEKFITYYKLYRVDTEDSRILHLFKCDDFSITVFNSKKVLFQGKLGSHEYNKWAELLGKETVSEKPEEETSYINQYYAKSAIGSDEVGTGDFFGPVVVCAAYIKPGDYTFLE